MIYFIGMNNIDIDIIITHTQNPHKQVLSLELYFSYFEFV